MMWNNIQFPSYTSIITNNFIFLSNDKTFFFAIGIGNLNILEVVLQHLQLSQRIPPASYRIKSLKKKENINQEGGDD